MDYRLNDESASSWPASYEARSGPFLAGAVGGWILLVGAVLVVSFVVFSTASPVVLTQREVAIQLSDYEISPDLLEVYSNTDLTFVVENSGDVQHDLTVLSDRTTGRLKPGEAARLEAGVVTESFTIWCSIKGHRDLGMETRVKVVSAAD